MFEVSRKDQEVAGARLDSAIGFAEAFEKCHFLKVDRCQQVEAALRFRLVGDFQVEDTAQVCPGMNMGRLIVALPGQGGPGNQLDVRRCIGRRHPLDIVAHRRANQLAKLRDARHRHVEEAALGIETALVGPLQIIRGPRCGQLADACGKLPGQVPGTAVAQEYRRSKSGNQGVFGHSSKVAENLDSVHQTNTNLMKVRRHAR